MNETFRQGSMTTQIKVNRNLAGLQFLLSRPDTGDMHALTANLENGTSKPFFHTCRTIMRDGLTVIRISLRVNIVTYGNREEKYRREDVHGRGTTFEMALFDLSAKLIRMVDENDWIDTENLPIIDEGETHGNKSIRADDPDTVGNAVEGSDKDVGAGLAARGDNSGGSGTGRGNRKRRRKTADRHSGRDGSKRTG